MYINQLLFDSVEIDFALCNTAKKRRECVEDIKNALIKEYYLTLREYIPNPFVLPLQPRFVLTAESRASEIIKFDRVLNQLLPELEKELKTKKSQLRICK